MAKTRTTYRMGVPNPETGIRPVNKVVTKTDGKSEYVQLEKKVAATLADFRAAFPTEPVDGAPRGDELRVITSDLSDDQLREMGLIRVEAPPAEVGAAFEFDEEPDAGTDVPVATAAFSSFEAEQRALEAGIAGDLVPGKGSGRNGLYTSSDVRAQIAILQEA